MKEQHYLHLHNVALFYGKDEVAKHFFQLYCDAMREGE